MTGLHLRMTMVAVLVCFTQCAIGPVQLHDALHTRDCPILVITESAGLGPAPAAFSLMVAIWPDGTILRAKYPASPWGAHVLGTLKHDDLAMVLNIARSSPIWSVAQGGLILDASEEILELARPGERKQWSENPGGTRMPYLHEIREQVLALQVEKPVSVTGDCVEASNCNH